MKSSMLTINIRSIALLVVLFLSSTLLSSVGLADETSAENDNSGKKVTENDKETVVEQEKIEQEKVDEKSAGDAKTKESVFNSSDEFKPSEEVSEDLSIPFPVDI